MDNGKSTIEEINTLEYYAIRSELPSEYIGTETIEDVPHNVRAAAWSRLLTRARAGNEEFRRSTIERFYKIWNYRHSHQGFDMNDDVTRNMLNLAYMSSGSGNYYNTLQPFLYSLDKYNSIRIAENVEYNGPMFMTRPRLCLQTSNLRNHRVMSALDTANPNSMAFMIRALLDTNLHKHRIERQTYIEAYTKSLIFNYRCPFMTPLCNAAASITGLPDLVIETATTAGGFMAEAQQFAIGGDNLHRASYELNITFKDVQHSPIFAILYYWLEYIRCVTRGYMLAYADDIDQQRINYTVSIYLFNLDPSRKYITKWCKCTGCFPRALPIGAMLSREYNGAVSRASRELSIPFVCNIVEYMDPAILMDFNQLVTRYNPDINKNTSGMDVQPDEFGRSGFHKHPPTPDIPILNLTSMPYITSDPYGTRLEWRLIGGPGTGSNMPLELTSNSAADSSPEIDLSILEMLQQNKSFSAEGESLMESVNRYYYPGFAGKGKKFNLEDFSSFIAKAIGDTKQTNKYKESEEDRGV